MDTITALEARKDIEKLWEKTSRGPVMVVNAGKPVAVVVAPEEYEALRRTSPLPGRPAAQPGFAKHLFPNWDIDVLMSIPTEDMFADSMT